MKMRLAVRLAVVVLMLTGLTGARAADKWLHISVDGRGEGGEKVRINLPLQLIEGMLPLVTVNDSGDVRLEGGRLRFDIDDLEELDLRAMLRVIRDAEEGEYISVVDGEERVRVAKEKGDLVVRVEEPDEQVRIRVRMSIVEALAKGENDLDLLAMVQALREHGEGELLAVDSSEETVRIWIDDRSGE